MSATIKAASVDDCRRIVLPESCPPGASVTIQELDEETWLVKRRMSDKVVLVAFERVTSLPDDPDWEKTETTFAEAASKGLTPPGE